MKKIIFVVFAATFMLVGFNNLYSQYIGFEPNNGDIYICPGTSSTARINLYWTWLLTTYPPNYTYAAYAKLITGTKDYYSNIKGTNKESFPEYFDLPSGTYTWTMELYEFFNESEGFVKTATVTNTFYVKYKLYAANNFSGGIINLEGSTVQSGSSVLKIVNQNVSVGAIDQNDNEGYYRIWNSNGINNSNWLIHNIPIYGATSRNYSYTVTINDNGATLVADLKKLCNVTFQNNFIGVGNGGIIKVNGQTYSSPTTQFQVVEGNTITAEAQYYYFMNGIEYTFTNWSDGSTTLSKTFTINAHNQITANYRGKPTNNGEYVHFGTQFGQPIEIYWTDNPNTNVTQYQIWRKVKHNGVEGPEQLLATVGRGVGRYVDNDYVLTQSYTNDLLKYDVRAYYSVEGTYSDPNYATVYGMELYKKGPETKPVEYSISAYPNPFNPSTTINYELPERSLVTIKIYDVLGREIKELINEMKEAGYYKLEFDGNELSSGIYICTINANKFNKSIKLMLVK
ncbi:MAG: T9SS type A sorting domain-containing protein [Melioribacteraceae bacterium]